MNIDNILRIRFIKDVKIPLVLSKNPYFDERIALYEESGLYPELGNKWRRFTEMLNDFDNSQEYLEYYNEVKDSIINTVKGSEAYERFNDENMNKFSVSPMFSNVPKVSIFKPELNNHKLLSIDMCKANFSSLSKYDPAMFNGCDSWEEFVGQFTMYKHVIKSKYIREATMGNCNPKRHITYEQYLMSLMLESLLSNVSIGFNKGDMWFNNIVSFSHDEVVFDITYVSEKELLDFKSIINKSFNRVAPIDFKVEIFKLFYISGIDGYLKYNLDTKKLTPKAVNSYMMPFLCCRLLGIEPTDDDMVFEHPNIKGALARFIKDPEFELPEEVLGGR